MAACQAGVFSLEDGLRLIAERGRLMQALPQDGTMVAVLCEEARVVEALAGYETEVSLAAVNGPNSVVVSGRGEAVEAVVSGLRAGGVETKELVVSHAFHSPLMEPMLEEFETVAEDIRKNAPSHPVVSNLSGELAGNELATAKYWRQHVRSPVRFAAGMKTLQDQGVDVFLEVGPAPVLLGMGRQCVPEDSAVWLPSLRRGHSDWKQMLGSLAQLYVRGQNIDWIGYEAGRKRRRLPLPTYPFQRKRFWIDAKPTQQAPGGHPLTGRRLHLPRSRDVRFETRFTFDSPAYIPDHRVFGVLVVAGASHVSMFLQASEQAFGDRPRELDEIFFLQPFVLEERGGRTAQLVFTPEAGEIAFELMSLADGADEHDSQSWVVHARGRLRQLEPSTAPITDLAAVKDRCPESVGGTEFYESFWVQGPDAGPSFRWIVTLWKGDGEAIAETRCPTLSDQFDHYHLHPGLIEACFQVMRAAREFERIFQVQK